jgi:hypothetical protein
MNSVSLSVKSKSNNINMQYKFKNIYAPYDLIYRDDYLRDNKKIIKQNNLGDTKINGDWSDLGDGLDYRWYGYAKES